MRMNICCIVSNFELTIPKWKSKVQVKVKANDGVFIKIGFSSQPAPAGKVSKKKDTAIDPKEKLFV